MIVSLVLFGEINNENATLSKLGFKVKVIGKSGVPFGRHFQDFYS